MLTNEPRLRTYAEAAHYASGSEAMIRKLAAQGDLTLFHFGRSVRVDLNELDEYLLRNHKASTAERIAGYAAKIAAEAPELTEEDVREVRAILRAGGVL